MSAESGEHSLTSVKFVGNRSVGMVRFDPSLPAGVDRAGHSQYLSVSQARAPFGPARPGTGLEARRAALEPVQTVGSCLPRVSKIRVNSGKFCKILVRVSKISKIRGNFAKFCKFLAGSFSAVSKRNFARKYAFDSIFQALQDLHPFAPLQSQNFCKNMLNFEKSAIFVKVQQKFCKCRNIN